MVMAFTVRALSVFLTVWLAAAGAFPPCCWSMGSAHEHQQPGDVASGDPAPAAHHHDHHGSGDSDAVEVSESAVSPSPVHDCDADRINAAATTGVVKRAAVRPAAEKAARFVAPTVAARETARSDSAPPHATLNSAFAGPLRI